MKILFISLGCDKNLTNTEEMLGVLLNKGYTFTDDENEADIVVVNTCAFINDAKEESINTIIEMAGLKESANLKALIVTGCLAERYKGEIIKEIPEVDAVIGTASYDMIAEAIETALSGLRYEKYESIDRLVQIDDKRLITTGGHYAHLKIAEGCNKRCTYCIIPKLRGNYRSIPMERLVEEATYLAENGVKELILVAQETTMYGKDLYGEKSLHILLDKLSKIKGIMFIRIMYCYPEEIYDELIYTIRDNKKICHYIDMPIQHCSDNVLRRMGRKTNKAQLIETINKLRKEIPDIVLRTTLIAGFPGETEEEHEEMMEFIDEMEFERLGVFAYSPEEDTVAANMDNQIEDSIKEDWRDELMELQQEVAYDNATKVIGREMLVMIEGKIPDEYAYVGRSYMDAPDIDGGIFINTDEVLMSGDLVKVRITGSMEYDLIGEII